MTATALAKALPTHTFESYLEIESRATLKYEFFQGLVYVSLSRSNDHSGIVVATLSQLSTKLGNRPCFVRQSDLKVVTPGDRAAFYPDASVFCNQSLNGKAVTASSPTLIVEVLSPSTRKFDLNAKRKEYFRIPSLRHYLLIDSESPSVLLYTRDDSQTWPKDPLNFTDPKSSIPLTALKISLKLKDLYRQTGLL